ncbi:MAG: ATP-binding cassette domain-containing protein [Chitinispirillaceae bacterium]|nr:ATP-binding cassette domain-containing protein [Chitinispirillaceae bacterium]
MDPVISVSSVYKHFGPTCAVKGLSFSVPASLCFGLLGPNGAGKTTMMKMVYGVSQRSAHPPGAISVFGFDPQHQSLAIKFISGVVPQENNLDEELNVEENLRVYARFYNLPSKTAAARIKELLEFMELTGKRRSGIRELSGGMKRRLTIARALLNNPRLLILDEPTTGLDPQVRHLIWEKLRNLKRQGMTILLTTHYMEEAFHICESIVIMNKGEKIVEGHPHELVGAAIEPFVLEVTKPEAFSAVSSSLPPSARVERSNDIARIYSSDRTALQELSNRLNAGEYYFRQSNLEDLFLKVTGSTLNAQQ